MSAPTNDDSPAGRPVPAPGWPPAGYPQQQPGYGYQQPAYAPRPKKPYAAALILTSIGFVLQAAASFLYFPSDSYSLTMSRIAAVVSGLGYLLLGIAAVVAVATGVRRQ